MPHKMTRKNNSLSFFLLQLFLLTAYLCFCAEGRPFRAFESTDNSSSVGTSKEFYSEVGGVSTGDGLDDKFINVKTMKNSGPSPGVGHDNKFEYNVERTFDEVKKSGPSPGAGHHRVNAFGEAMDSGRSQGNGHNKVTDHMRH